MAATIPQRELRNNNVRVLAAVAAGESFVITQHGRPIAELRPITEQRRTFVRTAERAELFREGPAVDAAALRDDVDRLLDCRLDAATQSDDLA